MRSHNYAAAIRHGYTHDTMLTCTLYRDPAPEVSLGIEQRQSGLRVCIILHLVVCDPDIEMDNVAIETPWHRLKSLSTRLRRYAQQSKRFDWRLL
jgi:hypothetical protein